MLRGSTKQVNFASEARKNSLEFLRFGEVNSQTAWRPTTYVAVASVSCLLI